MFSSPGMQSLMQQMMDNPQLMQNMMNAPYVQGMFQNISSNPELAEQIIVNNPLFAGNQINPFHSSLPYTTHSIALSVLVFER